LSVIQTTIDGRYQIITRIASGGMGEVYRAHDGVLGREVAIKVLHPHLAGDRGFVDRFRREARAAAILNHPSIVGVYDWGTTDNTYFMVMEFVRGTNLRAVLSQYRRLAPAQVVEVALPVLDALDQAHGHGIVHRDIKPENILISQDGVVKVADFGLARAYAESYVSQAEGTVTGTVQYLAPEQIQGEPADPRTDLYAVGVVMFELLTGGPPFLGETSLAIAYQHLTGTVPLPSSVEPDVPQALDRAVVHAAAKERSERPASARALRDEVVRAGVGLPPAPRLVDLAAQIPATEYVPEERASTVTIPRAMSAKRRRARRFRMTAALVALLVALSVGGWAAWAYAIPHYTHVPNVAGQTVDQAIATLDAAGFRAKLGAAEFSSGLDSGLVIRTVPATGARIRKGTQITVVPSKGPELVLVPDVHGMKQADAQNALTRAGFTVKVTQQFSDKVPKGAVVDQNPEQNLRFVKGSQVTIIVSQGPQPVTIPDLHGQSASDAQATLEGLGFVVQQKQDFSVQVPLGDVIRTDPAAGTSYPKGSKVTIVVSKGPKTFPMPNVIGMSRDAALAKLQSMGLIVNVVVIPQSSGNTVVLTSPDAGTTVHQGDHVTIYVTGP
jgi:eukaryotic-like serine/threonine-protein kinase